MSLRDTALIRKFYNHLHNNVIKYNIKLLLIKTFKNRKQKDYKNISAKKQYFFVFCLYDCLSILQDCCLIQYWLAIVFTSFPSIRVLHITLIISSCLTLSNAFCSIDISYKYITANTDKQGLSRTFSDHKTKLIGCNLFLSLAIHSFVYNFLGQFQLVA